MAANVLTFSTARKYLKFLYFGGMLEYDKLNTNFVYDTLFQHYLAKESMI